MTPISKDTLLEALNWRYATKQFDGSRTIPADVWETLEQALVLAPSSFGLQPWKFILVRDAELRKKLSAAAWGQTQPVDCSHFVVFLGKKGLGEADVDKYLERTVAVRGGSTEALAGYRGIMVDSLTKAKQFGYLDNWQSRQVYIALGQFMTAAALLGVDACPMEGLDPQQFEAILGVDTTKWSCLCACAVGYRAQTDKYATLAKVRFDKAEVVVHR